MFYKFARFVVTIFYKVFYRVKYFGLENLPKKGEPYIVICNHLGKVDVLMVAYPIKYKIYFLAKKEWFNNKFLSVLFKKLGGIPLDRQGFDITAVKTTLKLLKENNVIAIYPEGTRNKINTDLQPLKEGASMFAFKSQVKIVPMFFNDRCRAFKKCYMMIGKPFDFSEYYGLKYNQELGQKLTDVMRDKMLDCKFDLQNLIEKDK